MLQKLLTIQLVSSIIVAGGEILLQKDMQAFVSK